MCVCQTNLGDVLPAYVDFKQEWGTEGGWEVELKQNFAGELLSVYADCCTFSFSSVVCISFSLFTLVILQQLTAIWH